MQIRLATVVDVASVAQLEKQLQENAAWSASQLQAAFTDNAANSLNLVATLNDVVIAYALCQHVCDEAELHLIGVAKTWQRQGVAETLLATLVKKLADKHIRRLFLEVRASNTAAICLYKKHGFEQIGIRKNYYKPSKDIANTKEDAIIMQIQLLRTS